MPDNITLNMLSKAIMGVRFRQLKNAPDKAEIIKLAILMEINASLKNISTWFENSTWYDRR